MTKTAGAKTARSSVEEVNAEPLKELGDWDIYLPHITPCAYRGFNQLPVVYLHVELPGYDKGGFDISAKLTADEARQLAAQLVAVADEIGGAYSMEVNCQP
ncbi:MAG: hypothetical protein P4L48_18920 [Mycobacterium sp.]|nr:hypothetical protein [Mycobacterium sp.]HKI39433.1 hypothetical protein [Mycobacterium sp.]